MNFQIILRNSEMQPTFNSHCELKLVQTERKNKSQPVGIWHFTFLALPLCCYEKKTITPYIYIRVALLCDADEGTGEGS